MKSLAVCTEATVLLVEVVDMALLRHQNQMAFYV